MSFYVAVLLLLVSMVGVFVGLMLIDSNQPKLGLICIVAALLLLFILVVYFSNSIV